jgi:hypothetical protein
LLLGIESPGSYSGTINKGFDTAKLRQAFETFSRFPFYYHGTSSGNDRTEDEMMQIPVFAKSWDDLSPTKNCVSRSIRRLRNSWKLRGYYIGDDSIVIQMLSTPGLETNQQADNAKLIRCSCCGSRRKHPHRSLDLRLARFALSVPDCPGRAGSQSF